MPTGSEGVPHAKQRLFVGLWPTQTALEHAEAHLAAYRDQLPGGRWIPSPRWHATLAFLGDVPTLEIPRLASLLTEVASEHQSMSGLRLQGAGTFRGVLWLGLTPTERYSPADRLARHIQRELRRSGIAIERRPWRAHVTVARWKPRTETTAAARRLSRRLNDYRGPEFTIDSFSLVKSDNGPHPSYRVIQRTPLKDMHR